MKSYVTDLVGGGWDQVLALMTIVGSLAVLVSTSVITWLKFRLRKYFVTKPDHEALVQRLADEHAENAELLVAATDRVGKVETSLEDLATKHSMKGVQQRQETIVVEIGKLRETVAGVAATIDGMSEGNKATGHMMGLVLNHMLQRDKA